MTKILNFALKMKGGGREGGRFEFLQPCHSPKFGTCTCVSFKSSKNGLLVIGKIEILCLFEIQGEVTGEKSSNLRGNYLRQASKIWHVNKFFMILTTPGFP